MEHVIELVKDLFISPATAWRQIKELELSRSVLLKKYLLYLAAIPAVSGFLGSSIVGQNVPFLGHYRVPFFAGLIWGLLLYVFLIAGVYLIAFLTSAISPKLTGVKNENAALKLIIFTFIPYFVLSVFSIVPALSGLQILALYSIYLLYSGLPIMLENSEEKSLTFTVVISLISIVVLAIIYAIAGSVIPQNLPPV